jgi:adenylate kinase family enzyme
MKKIIVIGCPGSGKSTFSKKLNSITRIPLFHLDMMFWNDDKTTVERSVFIHRLSEAMKQSEWIIDGNYASTLEIRLKECDTVIFLDYPLNTCLEGIRERRGKKRSDIPWIETEEDSEFIEFIEKFAEESRPQIIEALNKNTKKNVIILKTRKDADDFLSKTKKLYKE